MSTLVFYGQFISSAVGVNGLTVTVDVEQITRSDGTRSALVTGASASAVSRRGLYYYVLTGADLTLYDYVATFITAGTADQKEVAALWTLYSLSAFDVLSAGLTVANSIGKRLVDYVDAAISTRSSHSAADVWAAATRTLTSFGTLAADVWASATRTLTQAAASVTAAVSGSTLTITRGDTFTATLTGLADDTGWSKMWFTVKNSTTDADTASLVQIVLSSPGAGTDGLLYLNGAAATAAQASITRNSATSITVTIIPAATAALAPASWLAYDVQMLVGTTITTRTSGTAVISADVTRATS